MYMKHLLIFFLFNLSVFGLKAQAQDDVLLQKKHAQLINTKFRLLDQPFSSKLHAVLSAQDIDNDQASSNALIIVCWSSDNKASIEEYKKLLSIRQGLEQSHILLIGVSFDKDKEVWQRTIEKEQLWNRWNCFFDIEILKEYSSIMDSTLLKHYHATSLPFSITVQNGTIVAANRIVTINANADQGSAAQTSTQSAMQEETLPNMKKPSASTPEDDNIELLRVQNQMKEGNYRRALDILSQLSSEGKSSSFYLSYSATSYERLGVYDSAALAYKSLYDRTQDFEAMKKVAEMKDKQAAKENCPKCHGTGNYRENAQCQLCKTKGDGSGKYCLLCDGSGKCYSCKGKGFHQSTGVTCQYCSDHQGNGKCVKCGGNGIGSYACYQCDGTGIIARTTTCYH
jgi:hypothetical protein